MQGKRNAQLQRENEKRQEREKKARHQHENESELQREKEAELQREKDARDQREKEQQLQDIVRHAELRAEESIGRNPTLSARNVNEATFISHNSNVLEFIKSAIANVMSVELVDSSKKSNANHALEKLAAREKKLLETREDHAWRQ